MDLTPKQQLADDRLRAQHNTDLITYIRERRAQGKSWQDIAFALRTDVKLAITAESIRGWASQLHIDTESTSTTEA